MNHQTPQLDPDSEESALVSESARAFFTGIDAPGGRTCRWQRIVELGWTGWAVPDDMGGSGLSFAAGAALHEEIGAAAATEPLTETAVLAAGVLRRSMNPRFHTDALAALVSGAITCSLVGEPVDDAATRSRRAAGVVSRKDDKGRTILSGAQGLVPLPEASAFLVSAATGESTAIYWVDRNSEGLKIDSLPRIDGRRWAALHFNEVVLDHDAIIVENDAAGAVLNAVRNEACLAVSAELLGAASEVFSQTLDYMRTRHQFGTPLSSFQALQHRAVDLAIQLELMRSAVQRAVQAFDENASDDVRSFCASQAKARTSAGALTIIKECIQLHGGIAYTEECKIGGYLKRAMVLAAWLGSAASHRKRMASLRAAHGGPAGTPRPDWLQDLRDWVAGNLDAAYRFPAKRQSWREAHSWHARLHAQGWVAPAWPKQFGGMGLSPYEEILLHEVYEEFGLNIFQNMGITMLGPLLQKYGSRMQQEKYLPGILSGDTYWCQGYSEPDAGSDLASLRTKAELDGNDFVVNGQKIWTSLAHEADMIFLLVRTDPSAKKQEGISFLLVDMKSPGISVAPIVNLTGAQDFCSVFFDNVRVPRENLVGELNRGWTMAKSLLGAERIMIGHPRFAKAAFKILEQYVDFHGIEETQTTMNELAADVADLEALYVRYLNVLRTGKSLAEETSILKICCSQLWQRIVETLREVSGMHGTVDQQQRVTDTLCAHLPFQFLHAIPSTIYGGTNEIQRNILARQMLKL